ncbi:50S ribosomal protein L10 [Candidatus Amesbacteria bacterium]|nr:50S ribosomal protein L10 [Candidatus Amesbacteria bacterium]
MTKRTVNPQKASRVSVLSEMITRAKSIAVVDYTKMTPNQATELRKSIKAVGGEIKVEKNTLFKIALGKDVDTSGLSAFVFSYVDEIAAPKVIADFIKKNNILSFKIGFIGDRVLDQNDIVLLAQTPSKEVSISKLLYLLNFNMSKLVRTLKEVTFENE